LSDRSRPLGYAPGTRFTPPRFDFALRRLKKSAPASAAFLAFRDAELAAR